ncbi:MAG: hypothetical protein K2L03_05690, partial [Bacteroidales bacterium]|nr:hypothetical protein [Bacteroidales bacterium]
MEELGPFLDLLTAEEGEEIETPDLDYKVAIYAMNNDEHYEPEDPTDPAGWCKWYLPIAISEDADGDVKLRAKVAAITQTYEIEYSDEFTAAYTTIPAATFAAPLEVKQGEGLTIDMPENFDLGNYLDGAFILYVANDDETDLTFDGTWNELQAWAQGVRGGSDDEDPGFPGFPDDDFGGYALTADEEPVAEPAYKVAYYDAEEETWRPAAFLSTVGDAVKVRARLAVGKSGNEPLTGYSEEFNATYKVSANTLKTPTFFVNDEELKAETITVVPGAKVSFESGYEAEDVEDIEYMVFYAVDGTDEDFDNASMQAVMMDPSSKVKMYDPEYSEVVVNKSEKIMARVGQMYRDGHVWWSASKEVTFEVNFAIEISPLLGGDTFGKNVALGVSVNIGETNPIGMPIYADNKYPTAVYYTTDGTTEPSEAAYDAQADKVNGAIKKLENTMEDGWAVMDGNGNTISLPLFDKDIHLKAKAYVTKGEETLETALFDKALKVKAGANPVINPVSGTVVKVGDKIVIKNPAPLPDDNDDEYGGFGGDGDLSEAALGTLYFSFDGTLPTLANAETQQYDDENEADPYHAWSVWTAEGKDVEITIQEDEKGLYAYVPAIGE